MSCQEQQEEELEVLHSIYEGDENFKKISDTSFQYKYGEDGHHQSFMLEVQWTETYPEEAPELNLDLFYNKHLVDGVKEKIRLGLMEQVEALLDTPMTFSLFEWIKDNLETLVEDQPESAPIVQSDHGDSKSDLGSVAETAEKKKEKKEQMSKAQKRKYFNKFGANTDKPRGWNWVDVVKHLSQTGGANN